MRLLLTLAFFAFTLGCGGDDDGGDDSASGKFDGSWLSECVQVETDGADSGYWQARYSFEGSDYSYEATVYTDEQCQTVYSKQSQTGSITETDQNAEGASRVVETLSTWTFTPLSAAATEAYTEAKLCDVDSWTTDTAVSVLEKTCYGSAYPKAGAQRKELLKVTDGTTLATGASGRDADGYPAVLGTEGLDKYTKQ